MSASHHATSWSLTPKNRLETASPSGARYTDSAVQLTLKSVIGTTTSSANGFDADSESQSFVCCAGPAVILSRVSEDLDISQQLFRARQHATPINATPSFYNPSTPPSTPSRSRHASQLKSGGYALGLTASFEYAPDSLGNTRASNRCRESTCVSLSRGGKFLAVGETGYNPRVLVFSTASDVLLNAPLSVLTDHSFGVSSVAFSRDNRWLCTVGNNYDGFVLIYSINPKTGLAKLHFSNKCSNVCSVSWMGSNVITVGTRHVKVWRLERVTPISPLKTRLELETNPPASPTPKTFSGRNCLLGALIDATFSTAVALSDSKAVVCTFQGDICLLDDSDRTQRLDKVAKVDFSIICVTFDQSSDRIWIAGERGVIKSVHLDDLVKPAISPVSHMVSFPLDLTFALTPIKRFDTLAIGIVLNRLITVNSNRIVEIRTVEQRDEGSLSPRVVKRLPAHESAVLGVRSLLPKPREDCPDYLSFSAKGTVLFWLLNGMCINSMDIPLDQPKDVENDGTNELKTLASYSSDNILVTGDKFGVLRLFDRSADKNSAVQAHSGEINGTAITKTVNRVIVASCGRDRTVQIFREDDSHLEILQTLDDHASSVSDLMFLDGSTTLLSISSDRTIMVRKMAARERELIAYIAMRVITLKASPVSLTGVPEEPNVVVVSTMDRQIQKYDIVSGRLLHSFKALDPASSDSVMMSSLEVHKIDQKDFQKRLLIGVSATDKSIRIHDYDTGLMLAREHGQTAISAIKLLHEPRDSDTPRNVIISCAFDGTVMTWDLSYPRSTTNTTSEISSLVRTPLKHTPTLNQPTRRILSKAEILGFQRSLESEGDIVSSIRNTSPSRLRHKTSRYSLAATPKISAVPYSNIANAPVSSTNGRVGLESLQSHSSTGSSPQRILNFRANRPYLDHRCRSKSAANLNDLNDTVEQICTSLRVFRKRITSSAVDKINLETVQELESELSLTTRALVENVRRNHFGSGPITKDPLDVYLARMIDERLALKAKPGEDRKGITGETGVQENENMKAGSRENALEAE